MTKKRKWEPSVQVIPLDEEAARQLGARELRRGLCLEKMRLEALLRKHFAAAIEGDTTCAVLYVKTSERLSSMLGTNAPIGHAVHVTASLPEADNGTSTTRLIEAIQRLKAEHQAKPDDDEEPPDKLN